MSTLQPRATLHPPLEWEGRLTLSGAKCEAGWGDLSTRALLERRDRHPTPPLISFASTLPLQGRVRLEHEVTCCASSLNLSVQDAKASFRNGGETGGEGNADGGCTRGGDRRVPRRRCPCLYRGRKG